MDPASLLQRSSPSLSFSEMHPLELLGDVGKYWDAHCCLRLWVGAPGVLFAGGLSPLSLLFTGGSLTARIPLLDICYNESPDGNRSAK